MTEIARIFEEELVRRGEEFTDGEFRPSSIGRCARQAVYAMMGAPSDPQATFALKGVAYLGHVLEENLVSLYLKQYPSAIPQYEITTPYGITAHSDLWVPELKKDIEVKSVSANARKHGLPTEEHRKQLMLRLHLNRKYHDCEATGEFVYFFRETLFDPDTMEPTIIPLEYDEREGQALEDRMLGILRMAKEGTLPEREGKSMDAYPCRTRSALFASECPYWDICWGGAEDKEVKAAAAGDDLKDDLRRYIMLCERRTTANKELTRLNESIKEIELKLGSYCDMTDSDAIDYGGTIIKRTLVPPSKVEYEREGYVKWTIKKPKEVF